MKFILKVYPNGMKKELEGFLKAALKFDHSTDINLRTEDFQFEYRIGVVNQVNPLYLLESTRSYEACDFKEHTWGFSKIATHDELSRYGFTSSDGTNSVTIRVFVRRSSHLKRAIDQ